MQTEIPFDDKTRQLLLKLNELWKFTDTTMVKYQFHPQGDLRKLILLSITGASQRIIRNILSQIKGGSIDGLENYIRSQVEGIITIKYILEDPSQMRARAYIAHDHKDRLKTIKKLVPLLEKGTAPGMATVTDAVRYKALGLQIEKELDDLEKKYGKDNLIWPPLEQRSKLSNSEELYATAFWLLSLDSHLTARGLDRYMREGEKNLIIETGQDLSRAYLNIYTAYISHLALLGECNKFFGVPTTKDLNKFDPPSNPILQ